MVEISFSVSFQHRSSKEILAAAEAGTRSLLTFEFLDDLADIPISEIIDTYQWVMSETTADLATRQALLPLWLHGLLLRKDKYRTAAFASLLAPGMRFRWFLLEKWEKRFSELGVWPERLSSARDVRWRDEHLPNMLDDFIRFKIYNRRDAAQLTPNSLLHRWGWHLTTDGTDNAKVVEGMAECIELENWHTYPPFFPGDTSQIRLNKPKRRDEPI